MSKLERFTAAAAGSATDRPPVGAWIHFGSALWEPEDSAAAHLRFYREYDWDYIKVMNDYRLATPDDIAEITDEAQFAGLGRAGADYPGFAAQLAVLGLIREAAPEAAVIETVFSPLQTVVRSLGDSVIPHFRRSPDLAREVLDRVTSRLEEHVGRVRDSGIDGLFLAVTGAASDASSWGITPEEFSDWIAPFDRRVLRAAEGLTRIIHAHGDDLNLSLLDDYPAEVFNWSPATSAPTIGDAVRDGRRVVMAGLDEVQSLYWPPSRVRETVLAARAEAGDRLIVAPGCTLHSDTPPSVFRALRESVEPALSLL
ncbi:MAG TPA: uroporphyrinogen decarboxylase family protein [Lacisediminihabitans sp.]|uniref:uroporphyrinogen decarboxylase family protein n=1 Tax=Lacisediminihabitans sp. TaxID=2787631 RepID=UPI002EDAF2A8